jgi:hypothetical protein
MPLLNKVDCRVDRLNGWWRIFRHGRRGPFVVAVAVSLRDDFIDDALTESKNLRTKKCPGRYLGKDPTICFTINCLFKKLNR